MPYYAIFVGKEHQPRDIDPILEEALTGLDVTFGRDMSPEDIAERTLAIRHTAMWLRRSQPDYSAEHIHQWLSHNLTPDGGGEAFVRLNVELDRADAEMREKKPDWINWYERG